MLGGNDIREVIAFPKNNKGADLMAESPTTVDFKQLRELYISSTHKEKKAEKKAKAILKIALLILKQH
mgnify:CR=1 FL=1